jgi:hypothetical protein
MAETSQRKERFGWRFALVIGAMVVLVLMVSEFYQRMTDLRRLGNEKEQASLRLANQKATEIAVTAAIVYATSDRAVEEWARKYGKMKKPGDNPVGILSSSMTTPTPTLQPTRKVEEKSNLQKWIDLIFGIQTNKQVP